MTEAMNAADSINSGNRRCGKASGAAVLVVITASALCLGQTQDPAHVRRRLPLGPPPILEDIKHIVIHYDKNSYCSHLREVIFHYFGGEELVLGHYHAPCAYQSLEDIRHGGVQDRSKLLLQRSIDGGRTWPEENTLVLFDQPMSPDAKRAFLFQPEAKRADYDMFRAESLFFFGRTFFPPGSHECPGLFLATL